MLLCIVFLFISFKASNPPLIHRQVPAMQQKAQLIYNVLIVHPQSLLIPVYLCTIKILSVNKKEEGTERFAFCLLFLKFIFH